MNNLIQCVQDDIDEWKKTYLKDLQYKCRDCENGVSFVSSQTKVGSDTNEDNIKEYHQIKTIELCVTCEVHAKTFTIAQECFKSSDDKFYSYHSDWTCQDDLTKFLVCNGYKRVEAQ